MRRRGTVKLVSERSRLRRKRYGRGRWRIEHWVEWHRTGDSRAASIVEGITMLVSYSIVPLCMWYVRESAW